MPGDNDPYGVRQLTDTELPNIRALLAAESGKLPVGDPQRVPIAAHMRAIDAEISRRREITR